MLDILVFLFLSIICIGLIYLVHKYFGKNELYLLAIIYSVISFLLSFKIIKIFGMNINGNIIFSSGLIVILYYFIRKFAKNEVKKLMTFMMVSTIGTAIFVMLVSVMLPSIDDITAIYYQDLVFNNLSTIILYPLAMFITLLISNYSFSELKLENKYRLVKTILAVIGIVFIDVFVFTYFNYTILIHFDVALSIALDNYLIKTIIMVIFIVISSKLFEIKKVKK